MQPPPIQTPALTPSNLFVTAWAAWFNQVLAAANGQGGGGSASGVIAYD